MSDIDSFFRSPRAVPVIGESLSQLYLLRRDIDTCFGVDPNTGTLLNPIDQLTHQPIYCKAIWPGTMAILAGIDLLGKFLAGSDAIGGKDEKNGVGGRFKSFTRRYLKLNDMEAEILYQLRNALLHSFGLYSETRDKNGNVTAIYNFGLTQGLDVIVTHIKDNDYMVDVDVLRYRFNNAVTHYEGDLRDLSRQDYRELTINFSKMVSKHAKPLSVRVVK